MFRFEPVEPEPLAAASKADGASDGSYRREAGIAVEREPCPQLRVAPHAVHNSSQNLYLRVCDAASGRVVGELRLACFSMAEALQDDRMKAVFLDMAINAFAVI